MSTLLTGHAPSMFNQSFANVSSLTDQVAIGYLLNYTNAVNYSNFTSVDLGNNAASLIYTQVANKSLIIVNNVLIGITATPNITNLDITVANATFIDEFGFNPTGSNVFVEETFQINVTSADSGVIYSNNATYQLSLTQDESGSISQNDLTAWNYMRILNQSSSAATVTYPSHVETKSLGRVEGDIFFYLNQTGFTPSYKSIAGYTNMSAGHNMSYNVLPNQNTNATIGSYTYELLKIGWQDPGFNISSSGNVNNVVSLFATTNTYSQLNAAPSYNYSAFLGSLDYTGTMGANISGVGTSSLVLNFSTSGNPTQAFTLTEGSSSNLSFPATFVSINNLTNATQIANATYGTQLSIDISPSTIVYNNTLSSGPIPAGITTVLVGENLPSDTDHSLDNITLVMNTTQRSLVTSGSFSNVTVVYPLDTTNYNIGYLSGTQLTTIPYAYDSYMMAPPTANYSTQFVNPGSGNTTAYLNGLYAIYSTGDAMSLSNVTVSNPTIALMGALFHTSNSLIVDDTSVAPTSKLLYLLNASSLAVYNQTASSAEIDSETNTVDATLFTQLDTAGLFGATGLSLVAGQTQSMNATYAAFYAQDGLRAIMIPTDPVGSNAAYTLNTTGGSGITLSAGQPYTKYGATGSSVPKDYALAYSSTYTPALTGCPIDPSNYDGKNFYKQRYEIEFNGGTIQAINAKKVTVTAYSRETSSDSWNQLGSRTSEFSASVGGVAPTYKYFNTQNPANIEGGIQYTFDMAFDVMLPGVKAFDAAGGYNLVQNKNTASIYIPNIQMGVPYSGGTSPKLIVELELTQYGTFTHYIILQGLVTGSGWGNLGPMEFGYYFDARYGAELLPFYNNDDIESNYHITLGYHPASDDLLSLPYSHALNVVPQEWDGVYWDLLTNQQALNFMPSNAAAFTIANFSAMNAASSSNKTPMPSGSVAYDATTEIISVDLSSEFSLTFDVDVNGVITDSPVYFAYSNGKSIVGISYPGAVGNHNFALSSNQNVSPQSGVQFTSDFAATSGLTLGNYGSVKLLENWYYGAAWSGQTGYAYNSPGQYIGPLVGGVYPLIPTNASPYTTNGVDASQVRGYQNFTAVWNRTGVLMNATFGQYNLVDVVVASGSTTIELDFTPSGPSAGMASGIIFDYVSSTDPIQNVYTVNRTDVSAVYNQVDGSVINMASNPSSSGLLLDQLVTVSQPQNVPWHEKLALNNFFVPGSSVEINYDQAPVLINTAAYNATDNSQTAAQYVASASYTLQQSVTDSDLISNAFSLTQDSVQFNFNSGATQMLRQYGQQFYVDVAPIDADISMRTSSTTSINGATQVINRHIVMVPGEEINVAVNGLSAYYDFDTTMVPINFVNSDRSADAFNFKSNRYTLRGSQLPGIYHTYFSDEDLNNWSNPPGITCTLSGGIYTISLIQSGQSTPNLIKLTLNSDKMMPLYSNSGWWDGITIDPPNASEMRTYDLTFAMNASTKLLTPSIVKYTSQYYASNANIINPPCWSAEVLTSSLSNISVYPYQVPTSTALLYPSPSDTVVATPVWSSITAPSYMNNAIKVIGDPTTNAFYSNLFTVSVGDFTTAKVNTVFAADQMVVQNYAGGLLMRVGPDGHLYSGDVSTYSLTVVDNQESVVAPINGVRVPIYNSDVNL